MWECSSAYPKYITDFVPQVCTNEPKHGKAFCSSHSEAAEKLGRPSGLRPFLKSCGTDGENVKKEDKNKINNVQLQFLLYKIMLLWQSEHVFFYHKNSIIIRMLGRFLN